MNLFATLLGKPAPDDLTDYLLWFVNADVPTRLACYLKLALDGSDTVTIPQDDIAVQVGGSRAFVSTIINEWKRDGIIESVGRRIALKDREKLEALCTCRNADNIVRGYYLRQRKREQLEHIPKKR